MSSRPHVGSPSRASSVRAIAPGSQNSREWSPWFPLSFAATSSAISGSSVQGTQSKLPGVTSLSVVLQSTENEVRLAVCRAHLAREARNKRRHQSTRARTEDVTMAIGSPTPTVRQPTVDSLYVYRARRPRRISTTQNSSIPPSLSPSSESSSLGPESDCDRSLHTSVFSDGPDRLHSLSFSPQPLSVSSYVGSRYNSLASETPSLGPSSSQFLSISPFTQLRHSSQANEAPSPRPACSGSEFDWELIENLACLSDDAPGSASSPFASQVCLTAPRVQTPRASGERTFEAIPTESLPQPNQDNQLFVSPSLSEINPSNFIEPAPSTRESSGHGFMGLPSHMENGSNEASGVHIDEHQLFSRTEELLRLHKEEVDPDLWDEDHGQFWEKHQERSTIYNMLYKLAQGEMRQQSMIMRPGDNNQMHESNPTAGEQPETRVVSSQVVPQEEAQPPKTNVEPKVSVVNSKEKESGKGTAQEASDSNRAPGPGKEPTKPKPQQRAWSRPRERAQLEAQQRARSVARRRAKSRARRRARSKPSNSATSRPLQWERSGPLLHARSDPRHMETAPPRVESHILVGRDPNYDYSANRPLHEQRWRAGRRYTPNTTRMRADEELIKGLSPSMRNRRRRKTRKSIEARHQRELETMHLG